MKVSLFAFIFAASASAFAANSNIIQPWVIYGDDNRQDVYQVQDPTVREIADSTAAMIQNSSMTKNSDGTVTVKARSFGQDFNLCKSEPFYDQPAAAMCSASLVGEDLIATAGHCIDTSSCSRNSFVFNYRMNDSKTAPLTFQADDVYGCKEVVAWEKTGNQDYAVVRLDRKVRGHRVLAMAKTDVAVGDQIYVVGHPSGLPTKVTDGATVRSLKNGFFMSNLDTYGGNSGSAVFSAKTNEIVGILVRGEADFKWGTGANASCMVSNRCPADGCRGEDSTNISYVVKAVSQAH